jgi:molybdopterin molybdotransferase
MIQSRSSYGRISAENVLAPDDVPPFPTSHWDGYAVMAEDLNRANDSNPVTLSVTGSSLPGARTRLAIRHGEAVQVATGAPLPSGADSVVPVESVQRSGSRLTVRQPSPAGSHVYRAGEDVKKGEAVLRKGQAIRAQDVGLLVSLGLRRVKVWQRPKVSVLATGSELTMESRPKAGKVFNSHSPLFLSLIEELGCVGVDEGIARDDVDDISKKIERAMARSDLVLTLGGTSIGRHDYVSSAVASLRPELMIHGIKMDRGRVTGISVARGNPVLMMPGPVQGAMNAFLLLALPIIEVLSGTEGKATELPCTFSEAWEARGKYPDFRKVVYVKLEGGPELSVRPLGAETESMKILADADGYAVIPESVTRVDAGSRVMVRLLPGFSFA